MDLTYRPTDLPELRAEILASDLRNIGHTSRHPFSVIKTYIARADLYFVAPPMVDLALAAKESLPDFAVEPEDMPSPFGFIYFAKPVHHYVADGAAGRFVGAVWAIRDGEIACWWLSDMAYFAENRYGPGTRVPPEVGRLAPIENSIWSDQDVQAMPGALMAAWARLFIKSVWLLMRQPLAAQEDVEYDRAARKRLARKAIEPRPVRVITLRRPASSGPGDSDREYHHQWIVRGHWRQQWYPSREVHRPVWIAPHIKGPEGAPLLGGEKVYAWKR